MGQREPKPGTATAGNGTSKLAEELTKVAATVATAAASLGFVTAVGAGILWLRFRAAELPADQALAQVPEEELLIVGAISLAQYVAVGVAAVLLLRVLNGRDAGLRSTGAAIAAIAVVQVTITVAIAGSTNDATQVGLLLGVVAGLIALILPGHLWPSSPEDESRSWVVKISEIDRWLVIESEQSARPASRTRPSGLVSWLVVGIAVLLGGFAVNGYADGWLVYAYALAVALGLTTFAVNFVSNEKFLWTGVAAFVAAMIYGGAFTFLRTDESPKIQPILMAITDPAPSPVAEEPGTTVASDEGSTEEAGRPAAVRLVRGMMVSQLGSDADAPFFYGYVTLCRERGDGGKLRPVEGSGRLVSVPRSSVAGIAIGNLRLVTDSVSPNDDALIREALGTPADAPVSQPPQPAVCAA